MAENVKYKFIQNVGDYFPSGYFSMKSESMKIFWFILYAETNPPISFLTIIMSIFDFSIFVIF